VRALKNKLPRKRKKIYKKFNGANDYIAEQILNEVLYECDGTPQRFPKLKKISSRKMIVIGYW